MRALIFLSILLFVGTAQATVADKIIPGKYSTYMAFSGSGDGRLIVRKRGAVVMVHDQLRDIKYQYDFANKDEQELSREFVQKYLHSQKFGRAGKSIEKVTVSEMEAIVLEEGDEGVGAKINVYVRKKTDLGDIAFTVSTSVRGTVDGCSFDTEPTPCLAAIIGEKTAITKFSLGSVSLPDSVTKLVLGMIRDLIDYPMNYIVFAAKEKD